MNKEEMICKNCKYHYIEDISFDYPQSCCSKRQCTTEQWCKCYNFEYSDRYIEQLQQDTQKYKEVIDKAINNSQYWIDYYTRLNSDERIALRLQENIDILKEVE